MKKTIGIIMLIIGAAIEVIVILNWPSFGSNKVGALFLIIVGLLMLGLGDGLRKAQKRKK